MAQDLGLHRASDRWSRFGVDLFSPTEKQERRQVWWSCAIVEKLVSCALGRPAAICHRDYDTELPEDDVLRDPLLRIEEMSPWKPYPHAIDVSNYLPSPGYIHSCFRASASLSEIMGVIIDKIYSVRPKSQKKLNEQMKSTMAMLEQWYSNLPIHLQVENRIDRSTPPPHVLTLHIQYWAAVILLHRKTVRHKKVNSETTPLMTAFEICENAAAQMNGLFKIHRSVFTLEAGPPSFPSYLLSEGIVHLMSLSLKPDALYAKVALQQVYACLKDMETVWPSATRNWELLNGARLKSEQSETEIQQSGTKRDARSAFGHELFGQGPIRDHAKGPVARPLPTNHGPLESGDGSNLMASMLGLNVASAPPQYEGYRWAPSGLDNTFAFQTDATRGIGQPVMHTGNNLSGSNSGQPLLHLNNSHPSASDSQEWLHNLESEESYGPFGNLDFHMYNNFDRHF